MMKKDVILESGYQSFVYLARDNCVYKFFGSTAALNEQIKAQAKFQRHESPH